MSTIHSMKIEVRDASDGSRQRFELLFDTQGIEIRPVGFGVFGMKNATSGPVYIEFYDGVPKVYVFGDIKQEDPTHVISLERAAEALAEETVDG